MRRTTWFALDLMWKLMMGLSLVLGWSARAEPPLNPEQLAQGTLAERQQGAARRVLATTSGRSMVVSPSGEIWVWGSGQGRDLGTWPELKLGTGLPVRMPRMAGAVSVATGSWSGHSLALLADGTVEGWGSNYFGQVGDGTTVTKNERVKVLGLTEAVSIAAGQSHSLAVRRDGSVWAWGYNSYGQLGDGTTTRRPRPTAVPGLSHIVAVVAGTSHSLGLRADGTVWAWGDNVLGELGDGTRQRRLSPVQVVGLTNVVAIDTRSRTSYAVRADGTVWAWGDNQSRQLGGGSQDSYRPTPGPVPGLTQVASVSAGINHALALRQDGSLWAWGDNFWGQLGTGEQGGTGLPQPVRGLHGVVAAAADSMHSLVLRRDGSLWTWGHNQTGAMGTGTHRRTTPVAVDVKDVRAVASTFTHALAVRGDGSVWKWGLENGWASGVRATPERVEGLSRAVSAAVGTYHSLVVRQDGTVWAWGDNSRGQLGDGTVGGSRDTPAPVQGLSNVVAVAAGEKHSLALKRDGTVWAWGANHFSQLGDLTLEDRPLPVQVQGLQGVASIASNLDLSVAVRSDGTVWQWGSDVTVWDWGDMMPHLPEPVPELSEVVKVSMLIGGITALRTDGTVWQWYLTLPWEPIPAWPLESFTGAVDLVASGSTVQILRADGTVWNFGGNMSGERGFPSDEYYSLEVEQVPGLNRVVSLTSESSTVYALRADGTLMAWGSNRLGTIGDGVSPVHLRPDRVLLPCKLKDLGTGEDVREQQQCHAEP